MQHLVLHYYYGLYYQVCIFFHCFKLFYLKPCAPNIFCFKHFERCFFYARCSADKDTAAKTLANSNGR